MSMTREEIIQEYEGAVVANGLAAAAGNEEAMRSYELFKAGLDALRPVSREQVSEFKTCELVDELRKREGVETHIAEPYQDVTVSVNGPAMVLVVID